MRWLITVLTSATLTFAQSSPALRFENAISLPDVQGRIDHMSLDVANGRLFVAALGNNTVEVIDVKRGKRIDSIRGLREPQGVYYLPGANRLYVANGEDGTVCMFDGSSYRFLNSIELGDDADNIRFDSRSNHVYVGYGSGALVALQEDGTKVAVLKLDAHPESFQLEKNGPRIFVNLPKLRQVAVADRTTGAVVAKWAIGGASSNYPMALDEEDHRLFVVCRIPARLLVLNTSTGNIVEELSATGDSDDIFYDRARKRLYATGGEGAISVYQQQDADHYTEIARLRTVKGARTSFFSPDLNKLFVAARRDGSEPATIRIYSVQ